MGIEAIGTAIATAISGISSIEGAYGPAALRQIIPTTPWGLVLQGPVEYHATFDNSTETYGAYSVGFRVIILLGKEDQPTVLNNLIDYIETSGNDSVIAAIEADHTLGGACDFCVVTGASDPGFTEWGGAKYYSVEFDLHAEKY